MVKIIVVTEKPETWKPIKKACKEDDYLFQLISPQEAGEDLAKGKIQLVVFDVREIFPFLKLLGEHESTKDIPTLWILDSQQLDQWKPNIKVNDFLVSPTDPNELFLRIRRLLWQTQNVDHNQLIRAEDLTLDLIRYEVRLKGELVDLTYKEYELLKFLAANPGRVFTREVLLNKVWGYDYFGGTRTVDVHIRRLRSKIEDLNHTYIETVRNIGYRFKEFKSV